MNVIYQIYKKLLDLWIKPKSQKDLSKNDEYSYGICIRVTKDKNIDIICELPNYKNFDNDQLTEVSEKYAEVLLFMNKGVFKNQIFEILVNHAKNNTNSKLTLLIDNILSFYDLIDTEYKKIKKERKSSTPLIRPMSVFKMH
jgi:hypothetical protein